MFRIELKYKEVSNDAKEKRDIQHALDSCFHFTSDRIILNLNGTNLSLPLPYVFSDLIEDFMSIISFLESKDSGEGLFSFSQNDVFDGDWRFRWSSKKVLTVDFEWRSINSKYINGTVPNSLELDKDEFLKEWKRFFEKLFEALNSVEIVDRFEIQQLKEILNIK